METVAGTAVYAGILGLIYVALALLVSMGRLKTGVELDHGNHPQLTRRIRAHGNFAEYVPFALLLMAFCEGLGAPVWAVQAWGGALLTGRLLHAWGLYRTAGTSIQRLLGTLLTWGVVVTTSLALFLLV